MSMSGRRRMSMSGGRRTRLGALALVAMLLAACGSGEGEKPAGPPAAPPPAPPATTTATPARAPTPAPNPAPPSAPPPAAPAPTGRGDAAHGAKLYGQYCATCHGAAGKGDGPIGKTLVPRPRDHTDHDYMGKLSDEHIALVIEKGGAAVGKSPLMAGWGAVLSRPDIQDLVAHLRKLSGT